MSSQVTIWETIANTPWWMFIIVGYLLWASFLATKSSTIPRRNLIIIPLAFVAISIFNLIALVKFNFINISAWSLCFILGMIFGWLQFRIKNTNLVINENEIQIPGTFSLLLIMLVIFMAKYYFGYELNISSNFLENPLHQNILMSFYGAFTGFFAGRWWYVRQQLTRA